MNNTFFNHHVKKNTWYLLNFISIEYEKALIIQHSIVDARQKNEIKKDVVLLLEHPPVFTLGRNGKLNNLTVTKDFLKKTGITVIRVKRGGDITFHGPGQIVVYCITDLRKRKLKVADLVRFMEEIMIKTAGKWGINAARNSKNPGIWVKNNKLGSVGLAISHGITSHGFALNVNLELEPFNWINPCGLKNIGITSLKKELNCNLSVEKVRESIIENIKAVFHINLEKTSLLKLQKNINNKFTT